MNERLPNMTMRKYSTIVFDLGNVLIPFNHQLWIDNYNKIEIGLGDNYALKYKENYHVHRNYESGKISDEEFISQNLNWLNNLVDEEKFKEVFSNIFIVNEDVAALLPILKKKYKLILLSNTNNLHKIHGWEKYQFLSNFEKLILSHEVGAVKPEEKIYRAVEQYSGETPESHIFIDDILEYVNAAKNLGWDGIQFTGYEDLLKNLKIRKIL